MQGICFEIIEYSRIIFQHQEVLIWNVLVSFPPDSRTVDSWCGGEHSSYLFGIKYLLLKLYSFCWSNKNISFSDIWWNENIIFATDNVYSLWSLYVVFIFLIRSAHTSCILCILLNWMLSERDNACIWKIVCLRMSNNVDILSLSVADLEVRIKMYLLFFVEIDREQTINIKFSFKLDKTDNEPHDVVCYWYVRFIKKKVLGEETLPCSMKFFCMISPFSLRLRIYGGWISRWMATFKIL